MDSIYNISAWQPSLAYRVNDIVYTNNRFYYCISNTTPNTPVLNTTYFDGYLKVGDVELPNFLWKPSYKTFTVSNPKIKNITFGDGYEQRYKSLINNNLLEYNLFFDNRDDKEAMAILHFLKTRQNFSKFYWRPQDPFDDVRIFICVDFQHSRNFKDNNSITAKFVERTYSRIIAAPEPPPPPPPVRDAYGIYDSLLAHWRLTETPPVNGTIMEDSYLDTDLTVNGNNFSSISFINSPIWNLKEPHLLQRGIRSSATSTSYLTTNSDVSSFNLSPNYSRCFVGWASFQSTTSAGSAIFGKDASGSRGYWLQIDNGNNLTFNAYDESNVLHTVTLIINPFIITNLYNKHFMFLCGYDHITRKLYLKTEILFNQFTQALIVHESSTTLSPRSSTASFQIGAVENTSNRRIASNLSVSSFSILSKEAPLSYMFNGNAGMPYPFY